MTGPDHYRKAEELAAKADEYVGQGEGQERAAVWAAVAQMHATLALAADMSEPPNEEYYRRWLKALGETTIPLLAGFSVTSVIVVSDDATNFRWPGLTVCFLGLASVVLILAVQFSYLARFKFFTGVETYGATSGNAWAGRLRIAYYCGTVALLAGLGLALAPLHGNGMENTLRWVASGIAFAGCGAEIATIFNLTIFNRSAGPPTPQPSGP